MNEIKKLYNKIAESYHDLRTKKNPNGWFYNELLEMPTTLKMLGDIKNKKVLDLGCGTGIYTKILTKKGAKVKAIDISEKEIEIAKKLNPEVEFKIGNAESLPYKNSEFDIVLAALVIEHFNKLDKLLREIKRVLKSKGLFIFSMGNPVTNCIRINNRKRTYLKRNYFKETKIKSKWQEGVYMVWYHKTYNTIIRLLVKHRFELVDYEDCKPVKKAKELFPKYYAETITLPYFCTWAWRSKK